LKTQNYLNKMEKVLSSQDEQGGYYVFEWLNDFKT
jgi:hypothetical protein